MERRTLGFWIVTGLFVAMMSFSGTAHLFRLAPVVEGMTHLGYPAYVMTILGVAKLLGVGVVLMPGRPLLKEWAYAGFTFNLLGATASHAFSGDPIAEVLPPAVVLLLGLASYALRPASRRISSPDPSAASAGSQPVANVEES